MRLEGQVAVITGGTAGIGAATAELFSEEGARVIACGRNPERGASFVSAMRNKGLEVEFVQCDATKWSDLNRLFAHVEEHCGRMDVLFANAGREQVKDIESIPLEEWHETIDQDLTGAFLTCKAGLPLLKSSGGGTIVIMSSMVASIALDNVAYASAQAGKEALVRHIALIGAPYAITCNGIAPGSTKTEALLRFFDDFSSRAEGEKWAAARHLVGRWADPREQAMAVLFLASRDAAFVTGHVLAVDGGYTAR